MEKYYDGLLYKIEYQPQLSTIYYTRKAVYYISTQEESFTKARKAISFLMEKILGEKNIWSKGTYLIKNQNNPGMSNAFHKYYEFTYDEEIDKFIYTLVTPYDD